MAPRLKSETREPTTAPNHQGSSPEVHKTILRPCDDPLVRIPDVCYFDHCSGYPDPRCRAYRAISGIKSGNFIEKLYTDPLWTMYPIKNTKPIQKRPVTDSEPLLDVPPKFLISRCLSVVSRSGFRQHFSSLELVFTRFPMSDPKMD